MTESLFKSLRESAESGRPLVLKTAHMIYADVSDLAFLRELTNLYDIHATIDAGCCPQLRKSG